MKKIIPILLFFVLTANCAFAKEILIPSNEDLITVMDYIENEARLNFFQKLIFRGVIKNADIGGIKLKDCSVDKLITYFNSERLFKKKKCNTIVEKYTGVTFEFISDGKCKSANKCYVTVDINGELPPNEIWTDKNEIKDRFVIGILKVKKNIAKIILPKLF